MKQAITNDWPAYHVFLAKLDGRFYRCSVALEEDDLRQFTDVSV